MAVGRKGRQSGSFVGRLTPRAGELLVMVAGGVLLAGAGPGSAGGGWERPYIRDASLARITMGTRGLRRLRPRVTSAPVSLATPAVPSSVLCVGDALADLVCEWPVDA